MTPLRCGWSGCNRRRTPSRRSGIVHFHCEHHERAILRDAFGS